MKRQITYKLSYKEIEGIIRENLDKRGFKNIDEITFELDNTRPILKDEIQCMFIADEEDLGENYSLLPKTRSPVEVMQEKLLATPLEDLDLSARAFNCMNYSGIKTLGDIMEKYKEGGNSMRELMKFRSFGKKVSDETKALLKEKGLI